MHEMILDEVSKPVFGAVFHCLYSLVRNLVELGHRLIVATERSKYFNSKNDVSYKDKWKLNEIVDGISVRRANYLIVSKGQSTIKQSANCRSLIPAELSSALQAGRAYLCLFRRRVCCPKCTDRAYGSILLS
jgi:hypothetical protein